MLPKQSLSKNTFSVFFYGARVREHADARFYHNTDQTARFFITSILPEVYGIAQAVESDDTTPTEVEF